MYQIPFVDMFCAGYMLAELVVREERTQVSCFTTHSTIDVFQIAGLTALVDASGFGFRHLRAIGMEDGRTMAGFFNISFPLWLRISHVLNAPRWLCALSVIQSSKVVLRPLQHATSVLERGSSGQRDVPHWRPDIREGALSGGRLALRHGWAGIGWTYGGLMHDKSKTFCVLKIG